MASPARQTNENWRHHLHNKPKKRGAGDKLRNMNHSVTARNKAAYLDIVEILKNHFNADLLAVYIFGSSITERETPTSDIDIAIMCQSKIPKLTLWDLTQEIAIARKKDVDLLDLKSASTVMQMQVVTHGRRVFCADEWVSETFEDFVFSSYVLLNEARQGILEDIKSRGSVYG